MTTQEKIYSETSLIVYPSSREDSDKLNQYFLNSMFYAVFDSVGCCYVLPTSEDTIDELESTLDEEFGYHKINASFEANIIQ